MAITHCPWPMQRFSMRKTSGRKETQKAGWAFVSLALMNGEFFRPGGGLTGKC